MVTHNKIVYGSFLKGKWRRVNMRKDGSLYDLGIILYG